MIRLTICFCFMVLLSCTNRIGKDYITVVGIADNRKGGAVVISKEDHKAYFVDGLASWHESFVGRTVKVSGKLLVVNVPEPKPDEPLRQEAIGETRIILKPNWKVIVK